MTVQASTTADSASSVMIFASATDSAWSVSAVYATSAKLACSMSAKNVGAVSTARRSDMNSTTVITTGARDGKKDRSAAGAAITCLPDRQKSHNIRKTETARDAGCCVSLCFLCLGFLLHLCPGILQRNRAVKHRGSGLGIRVDAEVAQPLELISRANFSLCQ